MPAPRTGRLTRQLIIDAALSEARADDEGNGVFPTGQVLGARLGVDRSAIWRHFRDRDDLLIALADAMLAPVLERVAVPRAPRETLTILWSSVLEAFSTHPHIGAQLGNRAISGENSARLVECALGAFRELGLSTREATRHQNAFADALLAAGAAQARYLMMSEAERRADTARTVAFLRTLSPDDFPRIAESIDHLAAADPLDATDLALEGLLAGAERAAQI